MRRNEFHKATHILERAAKLTARDPWIFVHLGNAYQRLGRLDSAIDAFADGEKFYYERDLNWPTALRALKAQLGVAYALAGKWDFARSYIESIAEVERSPEAALAFVTVTKGLGKEGLQEALAELHRSRVRNAFERTKMHLFTAQCHLYLNEPEAANREFEKAFEADRGNVYAMIRRARSSLTLAVDRRAEGEPSYAAYVETAERIALRAMDYDAGNDEARDILHTPSTEFPEIVEKE